MHAHLTKRDGTWVYVRRVPTEFSKIDPRVIVRQSTKVKVDQDRGGVRASRVADSMNQSLEEFWHTKAAGQSADAQKQYDAARKRARALGFDYAPIDELAKRPIADILARIALASGDDVPAVLGTVSPPMLKLSDLFTEFEELTATNLAKLSAHQRKIWKAARERAVTNLISVTGDKALKEITRGDALDFREWLQDRVLNEGFAVDSANKQIGQINKMLRTLNMKRRLGLDPHFAQLRLEGGKENHRPPFDPEFVQTQLLGEGALSSLNDEARRVVMVMTDTGMRPSEIVNLTKDTIHLDASVPYVSIRPDGRQMKTVQSERDIPLVGAALAAARAQPNGFPRYRDKGSSLSATVNKFLEENDLLPTPKHSLYSLRHTFKDRLVELQIGEEHIDQLMGHKISKPKYGSGPSLTLKQSWLLKIAFKAPSVV